MRWFVEVSSIGKTDKQQYCVDADSWQRALQSARSQRNDDGPMTGFSIELLDEGFSAVDPMSRMRYFVKKAPDEAPLSSNGADDAATVPKPVAAGAPAAPRPAPAGVPVSAAPPVPAPAAAVPKPKARTMVFGSTGSAVVPKAIDTEPDVAHGAPPPSSNAAPAPTARRPPSPPAAPPVPAARPASVGKMSAALQSAGPRPVAPLAPAPDADSTIEQPASAVAAAARTVDAIVTPPTLPGVELLFKREQEPDSRSPLSYREYVYAVPSGTDENMAKALLVAQFELVKGTLAEKKQGKLVNLAVFDVVFKGKPPVPPIVTLAWKDWKGDAVIDFPRRRREGRPAAQPAQHLNAPPPAPAPLQRAPSSPALAQPQVAAPASPPSGGYREAAPISSLTPSHGVRRAQKPSTPGVRVRGDELIADLFEAMHDLHFLRDAIEGADFCLALALEKMPSRAGVVHLYDIDKREFVVACARGVGSDQLLLRRHPEGEPLLAAAMRKHRATVIADATTGEPARAERYRALGGAKSVIVAPVILAGRFLGAIELVNPSDGAPFSEDEGHALTYIGEQYAEFVATRGVLLDPERIVTKQAAR